MRIKTCQKQTVVVGSVSVLCGCISDTAFALFINRFCKTKMKQKIVENECLISYAAKYLWENDEKLNSEASARAVVLCTLVCGNEKSSCGDFENDRDSGKSKRCYHYNRS